MRWGGLGEERRRSPPCVVKRFGGVTAVNNVTLSLEAGRIYGLIGPNGSGKTTLFNCITGVDQADGGQIRFKGQRIDGLKPHQIFHRGIGRTFQIIRVFPELTALENLLVVTTDDYPAALARAKELLGFVKLERLAGEFAGNLSYGEEKMLGLAMALMCDPELLLLDEPASGLGRDEVLNLVAVLGKVHDGGTTLCLVDHKIGFLRGLADRVIALNYGRKIAEGTPEQVLNETAVIEAYLGAGHARA